jgi:hypothetical protein
LLATNDGGLGNSLWKGTPRALVDRVLPALELPTTSPTLNNLAQRFLLSTANAPDGAATGNQTLTAMRAEKLMALGDSGDAWKLAMLAKPELMDDITLREVAEAAVISSVGADVCAKVPELVKTHTSFEWQKLVFVCQMRGGDLKAAQLSLDILHSQNVKDDVFLSLADKNIMVSGKQLPRQLTPIKPLPLALLLKIDLPLRDEVYAHPDAGLIPSLLQTKSAEEKGRLELAERAASRGIIGSQSLADVYRSIGFAPDAIAGATTSKETGARLRALLYQSSLQEKNPQNKVILAVKFLLSGDADILDGAVGHVMGAMIDDIQPTADYGASADSLVLINVFAGKLERALAWVPVARMAAIGMPDVATGLQNIWPLLVISGLESDKDYGRDFGTWLDAALKATDSRAARKATEAILLLLDADGFAVPDDAWAKVAGVSEFEKRLSAPAFLMERLRSAGVTNRRGEAVLDSLLAANGSNDIPLATAVPMIRALRLTGLTADAANLAKEMTAEILVTAPAVVAKP